MSTFKVSYFSAKTYIDIYSISNASRSYTEALKAVYEEKFYRVLIN